MRNNQECQMPIMIIQTTDSLPYNLLQNLDQSKFDYQTSVSKQSLISSTSSLETDNLLAFRLCFISNCDFFISFCYFKSCNYDTKLILMHQIYWRPHQRCNKRFKLHHLIIYVSSNQPTFPSLFASSSS